MRSTTTRDGRAGRLYPAPVYRFDTHPVLPVSGRACPEMREQSHFVLSIMQVTGSSRSPSRKRLMMRFHSNQHPYYCGVDLHTSKMLCCIVDQAGNGGIRGMVIPPFLQPYMAVPRFMDGCRSDKAPSVHLIAESLSQNQQFVDRIRHICVGPRSVVRSQHYVVELFRVGERRTDFGRRVRNPNRNGDHGATLSQISIAWNRMEDRIPNRISKWFIVPCRDNRRITCRIESVGDPFFVDYVVDAFAIGTPGAEAHTARINQTTGEA